MWIGPRRKSVEQKKTKFGKGASLRRRKRRHHEPESKDNINFCHFIDEEII